MPNVRGLAIGDALLLRRDRRCRQIPRHVTAPNSDITYALPGQPFLHRHPVSDSHATVCHRTSPITPGRLHPPPNGNPTRSPLEEIPTPRPACPWRAGRSHSNRFHSPGSPPSPPCIPCLPVPWPLSNIRRPSMSCNSSDRHVRSCATPRRASNPAWYQDALELNFQLHIRPDGPQVSPLSISTAKRTSGAMALPDRGNPARSLETGTCHRGSLRHARANGATSLGVILHIADEFATTELKPELDNPASLSRPPGHRRSMIRDRFSKTPRFWRTKPHGA